MFHVISGQNKFGSLQLDDVVIEFYGDAGDYSEVESVRELMLSLGYEEVDKDDSSDSSDLLCWSVFSIK